MCFSATASFGAAAALTGIGCAGLTREVPRSSRAALAIPFLFAAQQAAEGIVWVTIGDPASALHAVAVDTYLVFAVALWPTWMPFAVMRAERNLRRRKRMAPLLALGIAGTVTALLFLAASPPSAVVTAHSLRYRMGHLSPLMGAIVIAGYVVTAVLPFLLASERWLRAMGYALAISLAAVSIVWNLTYISVWCFFAALLSVIVVAGATEGARLPSGFSGFSKTGETGRQPLS